MIRAGRQRHGTALLAAAAILAIFGAHAVDAAGNAAQAASPTAGAEPAVPMVAAKPNPAAASAEPAASPAPPAPNLEPLAARDYTGILGKKVIGPDDKELGLLTDILVDSQGRPHAAVIDVGGFLGVGSRKIAVDWRLLTLTLAPSEWKVSVNLTRSEIQGAPEYKPDEAAGKMVGPSPRTSPSSDTR
jgi:hypothetical protein